MDFLFVLNSLLLGVGLTMDAFSVSVSNALAEPNMKRGKAVLIAGTFAVFQAYDRLGVRAHRRRKV